MAMNSGKIAANIDDYIAAFPEDVQEKLKSIRQTIRKVAPKATEVIKYAIPTFYQDENLVHFAGYKAHIGFYPTPPVIKAFAKDLTKYKQSKGAIQFPLDEKLPLTLITKMVKFRLQQLKTSMKPKK